MGSFYVIAGVHHFFLLDQLTRLIGTRRIPAPRFVLICGSLFQSIAGILLVLGICHAWAAMGLIVFTLTAGIVLLNFWDQVDDQRRDAVAQWRSNLALIGGLLALAATQ